jgi:uncharacterized membrane protein YdjX (TVP38/TMEM64 family)
MKKEQEKMSENITHARAPQSSGTMAQIKRWAPIAILIAGIVAIYASGAHKYLSLTAVAENRDALMSFVASNYLAAIAVFVLVYTIAVAVSLPGALLLTILGGFLFGWAIGGAITVFAATLGAVIIFLVARTSLGDALASKAGPWMEKLSDGFRKDAFNYMLFLRLVPVFPFWLVNIAPALAGVGLGTYTITTLIGIIPGTFAFSLAGSGLDSIIDAQKQAFETCVTQNGADNCTFALDAGSLVTPRLLAAFAALGVVALIPVVLKKLRARKAA